MKQNSPFLDKDLKQFQGRGVSPEEILEQIQTFKRGLPYVSLEKACGLGNGIKKLTPEEIQRLVGNFAPAMKKGRALKFVPASGAASRMFKHLLAYLHSPSTPPQDPAVSEFLGHLDHFAFKEDLARLLSSRQQKLGELMTDKKYPPVLDALLGKEGLNYSQTPKGLIPFHLYPEGSRTALEEHLVEAGHYVKDGSGLCRLHFTVSPKHRGKFENYLKQVVGLYEKNGLKFDVTISSQKPSTDTLAVDLQNEPFRLANGDLLFRPGGHGALLANLNDLKGDIVFIKNIDNVAVDEYKEIAYLYKRALGGLLVELQNRIHHFLRALKKGEGPEDLLEDSIRFVASHLGYRFAPDFGDAGPREKARQLFALLNRPLRVCGMVPNLGEPGGGPYWVKMPDGSISCQIVEAAQVNHTDSAQEEIFKNAGHFNPVDLVCGLRDFEGQPFNLKKFVDPHSGFISKKSRAGRELKALERPGLWNGAMAYWNTVFVEVPLITFSPVKTVNDLLRREHQV